MGIEERKQRQREQVRKEILKVAREIAKQEGWAAVSTRKIAEKIEYSTTKIYEEFGSREAVLAELQKQGFLHLKKEMAAAINTVVSPQEQLKQVSFAFWHFAVQYPELYQVMFGLGGAVCNTTPPEEMRSAGQVIMEVIKKLQPAFEHSLFLNWWALMHGFVSLHLLDNQHYQFDVNKTIGVAIDRFIKGIT